MAPITPARSGALAELTADETSRKRFLRMMGGTSAAAGLAVLLSACGEKSEPTPAATSPAAAPEAKGGGDIDIVNYALTLEYVEADFYEQAVASGMIKRKRILELAKSIGETEQTHVDALIAVVKRLGGKPVEAPRTAFEKVIESGEESILMIAATVENLGAAAYLGAAPDIEDKDVLAAALAIHSVEARHAAALNQLVGRGLKGGGSLEGTLPDGAFAKPMTMQQVLKTAKPFLTN